MTDEITGKPIDRVDGRLKVTGAAQYSAEFPLDKLAYGVAAGDREISGAGMPSSGMEAKATENCWTNLRRELMGVEIWMIFYG